MYEMIFVFNIKKDSNCLKYLFNKYIYSRCNLMTLLAIINFLADYIGLYLNSNYFVLFQSLYSNLHFSNVGRILKIYIVYTKSR